MYLGHFVLAANEGGRLGGQVVGAVIERLYGWEVRGQIGYQHLEYALRVLKVFQAVLAQVAYAHAGWQRVAHKFVSGLGQQGLASVTRGEQPGDTVEGRSHVV